MPKSKTNSAPRRIGKLRPGSGPGFEYSGLTEQSGVRVRVIRTPPKSKHPKGASKVSHLEVPAVFLVQGLEETLRAGYWYPDLLP